MSSCLDLAEHYVGTNDLNEFISWEPWFTELNRGKDGKPDGNFCVGGYVVNVMLHKSRELPRLLQPD